MDNEKKVIISLDEYNSLIKKNKDLLEAIYAKEREEPSEYELKLRELRHEKDWLDCENDRLKRDVFELLYEKAALVALKEWVLSNITEKMDEHFFSKKYIRDIMQKAERYSIFRFIESVKCEKRYIIENSSDITYEYYWKDEIEKYNNFDTALDKARKDISLYIK